MNFSTYYLSYSRGQFEAGYYWKGGGTSKMPQKIDAAGAGFPATFPTGMGIFGHYGPASIMMMPEGARRIIGRDTHGNFTVYRIT